MLALCLCACVDLSAGIFNYSLTYMAYPFNTTRSPSLTLSFFSSRLPLLLPSAPLDSPFLGKHHYLPHFCDMSRLFVCFSDSLSWHDHVNARPFTARLPSHNGAAMPGVVHRSSCGKLACYGPYPSWLQTPTAHFLPPSSHHRCIHVCYHRNYAILPIHGCGGEIGGFLGHYEAPFVAGGDWRDFIPPHVDSC